MKVIIAGSRDLTNMANIKQAVKESNFDITEVVSGHARGVDRLGEQWAKTSNISVKLFPADWGKFGKAAGFVRNKEMAEYADALIAIWDGVSRGTENMIFNARGFELKVYVLTI